jgi:hypothetical protein
MTSNPRPKRRGYLEPPLLWQPTGGRDDEDAVCHASGHELGDHEAGLYRFSEACAISQEEPDAAHGESSHDGDELVGLDAEPSRLHS